MSFSSDVRKELCALPPSARHCQLSELAAFINVAGQFSQKDNTLLFQTENPAVAQKYRQLLWLLFNIESDESKDRHVYAINVSSAHSTRILKTTGHLQDEGFLKYDINPLVVMGQCCKRAYLRGSFIAGGALSDPEKTYHLEFSLPASNPIPAQKLADIMRDFDLHPKILMRKAHAIVYVKEAEDIVNLLNIMEAHKSLLHLENLRIVKEMRNAVNRKVNFETANLTKTVNAAVEQVEDIRYIAEQVGLAYLSEALEAVARLRLDYQEATLKEIGEMLSPPVGKSGVNHRLRKISGIADALRRERND